MQNSDFILDWTENLKKEIAELPFNEDDIRKDFFGLLYDACDNYYKGYLLLEFSTFINEGKISFDNSISKVHVSRVLEIARYPILTASHLHYLNRNLLFDAWSTFELAVTTFCIALANEHEKEKLLHHQYRDIFKSLKGIDISQNSLLKIRDCVQKHHLSHVPITRKTDFLFTRAKYHFRDSKKDRDFLLFMGKFRNTSHANFIYHGKDYEYKFGNARFKFENGKIVKWIDPFEPSPKLYFYLIGQLKDIWAALINSIQHDKTILYPDLDQE